MPGRVSLSRAVGGTALGGVAAVLALVAWANGPERPPQASGAPAPRQQAAPPGRITRLEAVAALPGFKGRAHPQRTARAQRRSAARAPLIPPRASIAPVPA